MPAIKGSRQYLVEEKQRQWEHEVTCDVHGTSMSREQFKNPTEQTTGVINVTSDPRKARANVLGKTLTSVHHNMGLRK